MTGSLRTHGGLTPGREGKGREGNREGKNHPRTSPWSSFSLDQASNDTYVTRARPTLDGCKAAQDA